MTTGTAAAASLSDFKQQHQFFVGIDSDGCAFDSMEIKHKECFCPNTVRYFQLQPVSKYAREAWDFVNLYSKWRGSNRWPALVMVLDLLRERDEVKARHAAIPEVPKLREFLKSGKPLSNDGLKQFMAENPGNAELDTAMQWSLAVNKSVNEIVFGLPPFPYVRESLELLRQKTDAVVVSQTPTEALVREWEEHDISKYVALIAGQELGTKKHHLKVTTEGKYGKDRVLMIGDAPGDQDAARANNALFFPVNPGQEEKSWERFYKEGVHKFLEGTYAGAYEASLVAEFEALLPSTPPWKR